MAEIGGEANGIGRVLVVDDDQAVLSSLKFALELEGFTVQTYASGTEVLGDALLPGAGCLVIDYNLLEMNGLDLLDDLRRRHVELPAILITTHPNRALRARAAGASVPIVEKPLLGNALTVAIRAALADPRGPGLGMDAPTTH
ncbi:Response regulator receiver domain-containing protein [Faunimonas pinastri]|uniref:Response regulator receiver domain-containing protein n=1 Tax=Faunimonas pinastri TaxID=1855383 RepID=A0A1H9A793_9HYPH|nr:response regulator [Faunimonas pinastri]SEP72514.1 Response regulator receiver domain-containing protein [Faunimonas pinastri]